MSGSARLPCSHLYNLLIIFGTCSYGIQYVIVIFTHSHFLTLARCVPAFSRQYLSIVMYCSHSLLQVY